MLTRLPITGMRRLLRAREISAVELVDAHLAEIDRNGKKLNAFVRVFSEQAREKARTAAGDGPLSGIPLTVKDCFDIAGFPTLCGSRFRLGHLAASSATAVERLERAGAILLGKTNCPEFLANYETDNHITGRTNNPHNPDRTCGGSSGGEAAAIAGFLSAGGLGSDGGGSIRLPAHFCGICGLKPTPGRIPAAGHVPPIRHPGGLLGVAGPMARTAADLKLLFDVLAGHDDADPFSVPFTPPPPPRHKPRIGLMEQFGSVPVQPAIRDAVRQTATRLAALGYEVTPFEPRDLDRAPNVWSFFFSELSVPFTRDLIQGRESEAHWTGIEFYNKLKDKPEPTGRQVVEQLAERDRIRTSLLAQTRDVPVLLTPTACVTAFPHQSRRFPTEGKEIGLFQATMPLTWVNLVGFPALALPARIDSEGLPAGIQFVGRPWCEEMLFEIALNLESQP